MLSVGVPEPGEVYVRGKASRTVLRVTSSAWLDPFVTFRGVCPGGKTGTKHVSLAGWKFWATAATCVGKVPEGAEVKLG